MYAKVIVNNNKDIDAKIDEVVELLVEIRKRLRLEFEHIEAMKENMDLSEVIYQSQINTKPTFSSLQPIFSQLTMVIQQFEQELSYGTIMQREFVLSNARLLMGIQKELQSALSSGATGEDEGGGNIREINEPFQGVGASMKAAMNGNFQQLQETLEKLKALPNVLINAGYVINDVTVTQRHAAPRVRSTGASTTGSSLSASASISFSKSKKTTKPDLKQLQKNTSFGKDELKKLQATFKHYDHNKNGTLDLTSFRNLMRSLQLFPSMSDATLDGFFASFDADGSGTIDFAELATCLSVLSRGTVDEKLSFMFDSYDRDASGYLERNEIVAVTNQMKSVAEALGRDAVKVQPFIEGVLRKADADQSGSISRAEWLNVGRSTPSLLVLLSGEGGGSIKPTKTTKQVKKVQQTSVKELEGKTKFGKEELKKLKNAFDSSSSGGGLGPTEFKRVLRELQLLPGASEETLDNFFHAFDSDGSGSVDFNELALALSILCHGSGEEKLAYMFDTYDVDHSGTLEYNEIVAVTEQMKAVADALGRDPVKMQPFIEGVLRKADVDSDGRIERNEWLRVGSSTPSLLQLLSGGDWVSTGDGGGKLSKTDSLRKSTGSGKSGNRSSTVTPTGTASTTPVKASSKAASRGGKLSSSCLSEMQSKTNFGKKELMELSKSFKKHDRDRSGDLDRDEFKALLRDNRLFPGLAESTVESFFRAFDQDGGGTIDFNELITALSILSKGSAEDKLGYLFDAYDADKSGVLEEGEITRVMKQMQIVAEALGRDPKKMEPFIQNILKKAQSGNNGRIARADWIRVGTQTPSLLSLLAGGEWA